jgi:hypothetical protein
MSTLLGKSSTAEDVLAVQPSEGISNKVIIVTGSNTGIGLETVRTLANAGAHVMMTTRDINRGEKALESIDTSDMKVRLFLFYYFNPLERKITAT